MLAGRVAASVENTATSILPMTYMSDDLQVAKSFVLGSEGESNAPSGIGKGRKKFSTKSKNANGGVARGTIVKKDQKKIVDSVRSASSRGSSARGNGRDSRQ